MARVSTGIGGERPRVAKSARFRGIAAANGPTPSTRAVLRPAGGAHGDARAALDGAWDAIRAVAFLASKAGAYYSGCAFTLR